MKKFAVGAAVLVAVLVAAVFGAWEVHQGSEEPPTQTGELLALNVIEPGVGPGVSEQESDTPKPNPREFRPGRRAGAKGLPAEAGIGQDTIGDSSLLEHALGEENEAPMPEEPQGELIGTISGWAIDVSDAAVSGSLVSARGPSAEGQTMSGEDGAFSLDIYQRFPYTESGNAHEERLFTLQASKESYLPATELRVPLDSGDVELVLLRGGEIRGLAVDSETDAPIAELEARIVRHRSPVEGMMGSGHSWSSFHSAEGEFFLPTQYDVGQIAVRATGYVEEKVDLLVLKGEIRDDLLVKLRPSAYLRGIVLDAKSRAPVEGAHLAIVTGHIRQWWGLGDGNFATHALSGPDGRFEITQAPPDGYIDIMAWRVDYAPEFIIDHGPDSSGELQVLLSQGGVLSGTVKRDGEPIAGLRMWAGLSFGRPYEHGDEAPATAVFLALSGTGSDGAYAFSRMPYGCYQIRVMDANPNTPLAERYLVRKWAEIRDGQTTVLDFSIESESVVSGQVVGLDDPSMLQLRLFDQRYPQLTLYSTEERHDSAKPDAAGFFRFPPVPGGDYYVRGTLNDRDVEEYFSVAEGEIIEIVLDFSQ